MLRLAVFVFLTASLAPAERALLECTADADRASGHADTLSLGGRSRLAMVGFRTALIDGWSVRKATLLLHLAAGKVPASLEIAPVPAVWSESRSVGVSGLRFKRYPTASIQAGWIEITLEPAVLKGHGLALRLPGSRELRFHARETIQFSPYLIVEGSVSGR